MPQGPRAVAETEARKVKPKCGTERLVGTIPGESLQGFHKPWQGGVNGTVNLSVQGPWSQRYGIVVAWKTKLMKMKGDRDGEEQERV